MKVLSASAGWQWFSEAIRLFRQQPTQLMSLFFLYLLAMVVLSIPPYIGPVLPLLLTPVFNMGFMEAAHQTAKGQKVTPQTLISGFYSPSLRRLTTLGAIYGISLMIALWIATLPGENGWEMVLTAQDKIDPKLLDTQELLTGTLWGMVAMLPVLMLTWYAAPLVMWKNLPLIKAMYFSFYATSRNWRAFLVYGASMAMLAGMLPVMFIEVLMLILGKSALIGVLILPLLAVITCLRYLSYYPSYTDLFGKPGAEN